MLKVQRRLDQQKRLQKTIAEFRAILADPDRTNQHDYMAKCLAKATLLDERLSLLIAKHLEHLELEEESLNLQFELLGTLD